MTRGKLLKVNVALEAAEQNADTQGGVYGTACEFVCGQIGKIRVQSFGEKLKSIFMRTQGAPKTQVYYTEQTSAFMFGYDACLIACG